MEVHASHKLIGSHNVFRDADGTLIVCDSDRGGLAAVSTGESLWWSGANNLTRGLAVTDDVMIVGESALADRAGRKHSPAGLWVVDRKSWKTLDFIALGPFGGCTRSG